MNMATVSLTPRALAMLAPSNSRLSDVGYAAIISAANRSPYFAGQLNTAAANGVVVSADDKYVGKGTSYN